MHRQPLDPRSSKTPRAGSSVRRWRALYSGLIVAVGLTTLYAAVAIWPDPAKWSYNATANGFLLFVTTIAAVVVGLPAWLVTYGVLTVLQIPRAPARSLPESPDATGSR